jgi:hypothetical protein
LSFATGKSFRVKLIKNIAQRQVHHLVIVSAATGKETCRRSASQIRDSDLHSAARELFQGDCGGENIRTTRAAGGLAVQFLGKELKNGAERDDDGLGRLVGGLGGFEVFRVGRRVVRGGHVHARNREPGASDGLAFGHRGWSQSGKGLRLFADRFPKELRNFPEHTQDGKAHHEPA